MRRLLTGFVVLGLMALVARATGKSAQGSEAFQALKKEFDDAQKQWRDAVKEAQKTLQEARTDVAKQEARKKLQELVANTPTPKFAPRFLVFAQMNPKDPAALEAIRLALFASAGRQSTDDVSGKAVALLQAEFVTHPDVKRVLREVAGVDSQAAEKFVRDVLAKNPDRKIQAAACKALIFARERNVQLAEMLKSNEAFRAGQERRFGKEHVEKVIANLDKAKREGDDLQKLLHDKYGDLVPDLSVGKPAPEVVIQAVDGSQAKLSALKGKVVVLDIWATWCGPCRAMIPHEREMVDRLKDKPFALVSVSVDAEKKTLTEFLAKEKMPWTHWWNGPKGGILEEWDVQYYPTIYVIDARGVIRYKNLRGERLEEAVKELIKEAEKKPK